MKASQRLEKAMKKAEGVNETSDMTEREKAKQIEKLMQKGLSKSKKKEVKVVVAKGVHRGVKGRPKGVKGRYLMVDARMRKEVRSFVWTYMELGITCTSFAHGRRRRLLVRSGNGHSLSTRPMYTPKRLKSHVE